MSQTKSSGSADHHIVKTGVGTLRYICRKFPSLTEIPKLRQTPQTAQFGRLWNLGG